MTVQANDQQLIQDAKEDLDNFKYLYEKYSKAVFRYAYKRVGSNRELAEDITSDTFVKSIEKFESFSYQNKPFVVWLYTIAHNLIVDYFRSKKEQNVSLDSMVVKPTKEEESIVSKLSKEEMKEAIRRKSKDLPDELQNLFTLKHTEDLTFKEIGKLLGKTEGAVKMQYYRGLDLLKKLISQD